MLQQHSGIGFAVPRSVFSVDIVVGRNGIRFQVNAMFVTSDKEETTLSCRLYVASGKVAYKVELVLQTARSNYPLFNESLLII